MKTAIVSPATVAILDDHLLYRQGLINFVTCYGYRVIAAESDHCSFIDSLRRLKQSPQLCLIDLDMIYDNGIETARQVIAEWPNINVIILSMSYRNISEHQCLQLGVHRYLQKHNAATELKNILAQRSMRLTSLTLT